MLTGFMFLTLTLVIVAGVSLYTIDRTRNVLEIQNRIGELQVLNLSLNQTYNDFFAIDKMNDNYFETKESQYLRRSDSLVNRMRIEIANLLNISKKFEYPIDHKIVLIASLMNHRRMVFQELEKYYYKKGFRDFGIEGEMRKHVHALEDPELQLELADILSLRRREKDFLLREDTIYVNAFNKEWLQLNNELEKDTIKNAEAYYHLTQYHLLFNSLVDVKKTIGLRGETGLSKTHSELTSQLNRAYYDLGEYSAEFSKSVNQNTRIFYITIITLVIAFSLISAFWISKRLSAPISTLSRWINDEMQTGNKSKLELDIRLDKAAEEIRVLVQTFDKLMKQQNQQVFEIRQKSKQIKKNNKELKKINQELDSFLYSTAHDLRSPLSSLLGLIKLTMLDNKQENLSQYFLLMQQSVHRLDDFLQQIVDYSKNKRIELLNEPIDINKLLEDCFNNHNFLDGSDKIEKIVEIKEDAHFFSDRSRLSIIFNNLISNAIRYADFDKPTSYIRIKIHCTASEMILDFADNGVGIEEIQLKKIFNMFYRGNTKSKGSGLGLFIFKETVTKLGGFASVESEAGVGTKFFVKVPNGYMHEAQHNPELSNARPVLT